VNVPNNRRIRSAQQSRTLLVWALLLGVSAAYHWVHLKYPFDDAYIHARIARNFVEHGAPYYNPGDALKTSSSSGWTVIVAGLFSVFGAGMRPIAALNAIVLTGLVAGLWTLLRPKFQEKSAVLILICAAVAGSTLSASVGLMETPLALTVICWGLVLVDRGKPVGFFVLGLAVCVRLEAALVLGAVLGVLWLRRTPRVLRAGLLAGLGVLPLVIYDLWFFGTLVPQPVRAKSVTYQLSRVQSIATSTQEFTVSPGPALLWALVAVTVAGVFLVRQLRQESRRPMSDPTVGWIAGGSLVWCAYVAVRGFVFPWYLPLYLVVFVIAALLLAEDVRRPLALAAAIVVVMPVFTIWGFMSGALFGAFDWSETTHQNARVNEYLEIGEALYDVCPECSLATSEIGGLGYSFAGRIEDAVGLVTPSAVSYHPMSVPEERPSAGLGSIPPLFIRDTEPDFVVTYDIFGWALIRSPVVSDYWAWACPVLTERDENIAWSYRLWGIDNLWVLVARDGKADASTIRRSLEEDHRCQEAQLPLAE
jgi:hypothetical protein